MFRLLTTPRFDRQLHHFRRAHPDLRERVDWTLADPESDPHSPRLRLHPLQGQHAGLHAVSVTRSYRIVLSLDASAEEVLLVGIGSHDEVYR